MRGTMTKTGKWLLIAAISATGILTGAGNGLPRAEARLTDPISSRSFSDTQSHWAKKEIEEAVRAGWVQGFPDATFRPEQPVSKEQFMALLERVLPAYQGHEPEEFTREQYLADVQGRWSEKTYTHLLAAGIIPYGKPDEPLTRVEAARLSLAALGKQSEGEKYRGTASRFFRDISPDNEYQVLMVYPIYKLGVMTGFPDGSFRPEERVSRAQAVVLLKQIKEAIAELYPGQVTEAERQAMTKAVSTFVTAVMDEEKIRRYDDLVKYVEENKWPVTEKFLQEHFSFMKYEVYDFARFPRFDELIYYAKISEGKYRMTVQYYSGELGGSLDRTFYLASEDGKNFRLIGKDE
ncbi:S-layer homology domain-containing protein [Brevibacillus composti]|uniref:S-layer homology domain-containing protein n=2 Tax=Brevibacillus composti TaxID=2796470 RepID=A0A7T5JQ83_9BACL|nr:S-layer homology domain-containing protein [Brevibacillus composti]QQE75885.1 S-layer homology domain-containing protein [Brevibacillus composti]QUO42911.1 S-layer homology domain-containing protein [Brevibacillus composti]